MCLINHLPGIALPVSKVMSTLSQMWNTPSVLSSTKTLEPDYRASQMNVILHFGPSVTPEDALTQFSIALKFACIYPCRLVILCPHSKNDTQLPLTAKLFAQCYIGSGPKNISTCEALMVAYPLEESNYLENQVSIWLDNDLPTYYWVHRIPATRIANHYLGFLKSCHRIIYDSSIESESFHEINWPRNLSVRNLAFARMLNARQTIGQALSNYPPTTIINNLKKISASYPTNFAGETHSLMHWIQQCLQNCSPNNTLPNIEWLTQSSENNIEVIFEYSDNHYFKWQYTPKANIGLLQTNLNNTSIQQSFPIQCIAQEIALAQSIFF